MSRAQRATLGFAVRADFRRLYPANAKTPTCCPSDDNRTKVTNSATSARSLWWHVGPYFWPGDLTRTANPIRLRKHRKLRLKQMSNNISKSLVTRNGSEYLVARQRHLASGAAIIMSLASAVCIFERFICLICIMYGGFARV